MSLTLGSGPLGYTSTPIAKAYSMPVLCLSALLRTSDEMGLWVLLCFAAARQQEVQSQNQPSKNMWLSSELSGPDKLCPPPYAHLVD